MQMQGLLPNAITYSSLITAYQKGVLSEQVFGVLQAMQ